MLPRRLANSVSSFRAAAAATQRWCHGDHWPPPDFTAVRSRRQVARSPALAKYPTPDGGVSEEASTLPRGQWSQSTREATTLPDEAGPLSGKPNHLAKSPTPDGEVPEEAGTLLRGQRSQSTREFESDPPVRARRLPDEAGTLNGRRDHLATAPEAPEEAGTLLRGQRSQSTREFESDPPVRARRLPDEAGTLNGRRDHLATAPEAPEEARAGQTMRESTSDPPVRARKLSDEAGVLSGRRDHLANAPVADGDVHPHRERENAGTLPKAGTLLRSQWCELMSESRSDPPVVARRLSDEAGVLSGRRDHFANAPVADGEVHPHRERENAGTLPKAGILLRSQWCEFMSESRSDRPATARTLPGEAKAPAADGEVPLHGERRHGCAEAQPKAGTLLRSQWSQSVGVSRSDQPAGARPLPLAGEAPLRRGWQPRSAEIQAQAGTPPRSQWSQSVGESTSGQLAGARPLPLAGEAPLRRGWQPGSAAALPESAAPVVSGRWGSSTRAYTAVHPERRGELPQTSHPGRSLGRIDERGTALLQWTDRDLDRLQPMQRVSDEDNSLAMGIKDYTARVKMLVKQGGRLKSVNRQAVLAIAEELDNRMLKGRRLETMGGRSLTSLLVFHVMIGAYDKAAEVDKALERASFWDELSITARLLNASAQGNAVQVVRLLVQAKARGIAIGACDSLLRTIRFSDNLYNAYEITIDLLKGIEEHGLPITRTGYVAALQTASSYSEAVEMTRYFSKCTKAEWNENMWTAFVQACRYDPKSGEKVVAEMKRRGRPMNTRVLAALMRLYNQVWSFEEVTRLFREALLQGMTITPVIITELVHACGRQAEKPHDEFVQAAEDAWATALSLGMEDDPYLWESMMQVYVNVGDGASAGRLLRKCTTMQLHVSQRLLYLHHKVTGAAYAKPVPETKRGLVDEAICNDYAATVLAMLTKRGGRSGKDRDEDSGGD
ncbi:hypothetical protein DIPPA_02949 [Diplonema papillatum]|nr:hypothetical protein DIPPA_02949 [Diplonema papillatum]